MIDYETFCKIRDAHEQQGLNAEQIARSLGLDRRTVAKWLAEPRFRARQSSVRASKLDPYKARIRQWPRRLLKRTHLCSRKRIPSVHTLVWAKRNRTA